MGEEFRFIGKKIPRQDALDIVTGRVRFLNDIRLPNMLYGHALRSPYAHALIKKVDKSRALRLKGVKAVLTWEDVPDWKGGSRNTTRILDRKVRFVGDVVALVAAETKRLAIEAARLLKVEYEVLPHVLSPDEAMREGAPLLYDEYPGNILPSGVPQWGGPRSLKSVVMGNVEEGLKEAHAIAEGEFRYEHIPNPIPLESPGAIGLWEEPNRMTIWVSDQAFYKHVEYLRRIVGEEIEIRTFGLPCGGSYGSKSMSWQVQLYAVLLSRATGCPVHFSLTKHEHLATFVLRPSSRIKGKVGMKRDGTVTAISGTWLVDTGYYSQTTQAQVAVGCGEAQLAIRSQNWDLRSLIVCTNRTASGIVRGFGGQELKCSLIPLLCLAMAKLDVDPVDFFKKNFAKPGDGYFWRDGLWYTYRGVDPAPVIEEGARRFGWREKWKGWLRPTSVDGQKRRGVGVGIHGNADVGEDASEAYVRLDWNGTATIFSCLTEHGTGQKTNIARMAAEVLQLSMERMRHAPADSLIGPRERGPGGSRMTYAAGSAVIKAAEDAREKLLILAAPLFGTTPEDLDTKDGMVFQRHKPEKRIPWSSILEGTRTVMGYGRFEPDYSISNCLVTFVEVEVDTETGKVDLLKVFNATNAGRIIDPQSLEGQLNGCLGSAGIDTAIFEETIMDGSTGHILNANLVDYKWRTFLELPEIENVILEIPYPTHRFHAVGVGEIATSPGPLAVWMAVCNAVGQFFYEYPLTPERVLAALKRGGKV